MIKESRMRFGMLSASRDAGGAPLFATTGTPRFSMISTDVEAKVFESISWERQQDDGDKRYTKDEGPCSHPAWCAVAWPDL